MMQPDQRNEIDDDDEARAVRPRWGVDTGIRFLGRTKPAELSYDALRMVVAHSPEAALALAVLVDAVECFRRYAWSRRKADQSKFRAARRWLSDDYRATDGLSCSFICDSLGIDRTAVIEHLRAWHALESARRAERAARRRAWRDRDVAA